MKVTENLKFMQVQTFYPAYLEGFYKKNQIMRYSSFDEKIAGLIRDGFSGIHTFTPYLEELGYDSQFIIANDHQSQFQWLVENKINLKLEQKWEKQLLRVQIETIKPDILYFCNTLTFDSNFIRSLSYKPKIVMGWRAANIPSNADWSAYDIILSALSPLREIALKLGAKSSEHFFPGFEPSMNAATFDVQPKYDVVFSGQWTQTQHLRRNQYLERIARVAAASNNKLTCGYYLAGQRDTFPPDVAKYDLGERFGIDMYRALRTGRIAVDARAHHEYRDPTTGQIFDIGGTDTANMRTFEVTGSGIFLLTEHYDNLGDYFELGSEIETFHDEKELFDKLSYYLAHPEKRLEIAIRGQQRCLRDYSMPTRAKDLDRIIRKYLGGNYVANVEKVSVASHVNGNMTGDISEIENIKKQSMEAIQQGKVEIAFAALNKAKSYKQPVRDLDFLRAICFLQMKTEEQDPFMVTAKQALKEELRYFPDNDPARQFLGKLESEYPEASSAINDPEFAEIYNVIKPYTMVPEIRLYSLFKLVKKICIENVPGNIVECGVAAGGSTALMAYMANKYSSTPRMLYAFDSFDGMPEPTAEDVGAGISAQNTGWGTGTCAAPEDSVREICEKLGVGHLVKTVKGYFEDTLPKWRDEVGTIAFMHMDGDWYKSTKTILDELYDSVGANGVVQSDDYGYWKGCDQAIHEFEERRNIKLGLNRLRGPGMWFEKSQTVSTRSGEALLST